MAFRAAVFDTMGNLLSGVVLSIDVIGDPGAIKMPPNPTTDANGFADFSIDNITQDGTTVSVSAGGVGSNVISVTIVP